MKLFISVHKTRKQKGREGSTKEASGAEPLAEGPCGYHAVVSTSRSGTASISVKGDTMEELGKRIAGLMKSARDESSCIPEFNMKFAPESHESPDADGRKMPLESGEISQLFKIISETI